MPIHLDIAHLDRLVSAVILGEVTPEFVKMGRQHYGKIIDTTAGTSPIDENRMATHAAFKRAGSKAGGRVAPIDKLNIVLVAVFAGGLPGRAAVGANWGGVALMAAGALFVAYKG
ncbi:MAG: hypothetical protein FD144_5900 [Rhodospirillaceae bacterium]|nr:MAG: hypothetical protein FD144_5900 [Rhodospirillaceae bacterium]